MDTRLKFVRFAMTVLAAPLLLWLMSGLARAAVPSNDTFPNATEVTLGFSGTFDTTQATTDADDVQLTGSCFPPQPVTDASVWYAFTLDYETVVLVDVSESNYSAGVVIGVVVDGQPVNISCGSGSAGFQTAPGETYYVMAFDDQNDGGGNGGTLNISIAEVPPTPPPPTVDITLDSAGQFEGKTGTATISGTYTCKYANGVSIFAEGKQRVGRFTVSGFGGFLKFDTPEVGICDGTPHPWTIVVTGQNGTFAGGQIEISLFANACLFDLCGFDNIEKQTVQMRGSKKAFSAAVPSGQLFLPSISTSD